VADKAAGGAESCPATAAGVRIVVRTFPCELGASRTVPRPIAHVEIGFDGAKNEFTAFLAGEGDVRGFEQIKVLPLIHLDNPPPSGKGSGEGRSTPNHGATAFGLRSRTRLQLAARWQQLAGDIHDRRGELEGHQDADGHRFLLIDGQRPSPPFLLPAMQ